MIPLVNRILNVVLPLAATIMAGACSSTEIIDQPSGTAKKGKTISLSVSSPQIQQTRGSHDNHKLRYIAKLVEGNMKDTRNLLDRKEVIASDGDATITFSVEEGLYTIVLFADYIDSDEPDETGCYTDCYYDTHDPNYPEIMKISRFDVNNDNLDCFGAVISVDKGEEEVVRDIVLERKVSKIRFVSTTASSDSREVSGIQFTKIPYYSQINLSVANTGVEVSKHYSSGEQYIPQGDLSGVEEAPELFYFYSLANKTGDLTALAEVGFTVNYNDNTSKSISIPLGVVKSVRNSITTVQGAFLSPEPKTLGDIILNLSTPDGWEGSASTSITIDVDW